MTTLRAAAQQALEVLESGLLVSHHAQVLIDLRAALAQQAEPVQEPEGMVEFLADLQRSRTKYPKNRRMFDGLMGEIDELRRAYAGDGDIRAEAFDVAVCAFRIATEGDAGGNARLEQAEPVSADPHTTTLRNLLECCLSWEPDACVLGNVTARQAITALRAALAQQDEPAREWVSMDEYKRLQGLVTSQGIRLMEYESKQPQQAEPVAWSGYDLDGMVEAFSRVIEAHHTSKHPFHDPIDTDARTALRILRGITPAMKAYTAPPQRKPLTEEDEIMDAVREADLDWQAGWTLDEHEPNRFTTLVRAIERAHGIKETQ